MERGTDGLSNRHDLLSRYAVASKNALIGVKGLTLTAHWVASLWYPCVGDWAHIHSLAVVSYFLAPPCLLRIFTRLLAHLLVPKFMGKKLFYGMKASTS